MAHQRYVKSIPRFSTAAPAESGLGLYGTGDAVSASTGGGSGASQWTPTVANLLVIVVLEIAAFAALRYAFRVVQN